MAFDYSVQLYSVRTAMEEDPMGTLRKIKDMGYVGVEGYGAFPAVDDVKRAMSETGLKIVGYHTRWPLVQDDQIDATLKYFKDIGNKYVIVPMLPAEETVTIADWKNFADKFNKINKRVQAEGMILGFHNHAIEFTEVDGQVPFVVFFENTDPSIVVQIDNGNGMRGNCDVMAGLRKFPGRAKSVHLKPFSKSAERGFAPPIGEDELDWKEYLYWCRDIGKAEHYIVEYASENLHPQMVGIELCIKNLKAMEAAGKI